MNHGPEKTPHTDPDHPHEGSAPPGPGGAPEPEPPARGAGDAVDGPAVDGPEEPGGPAADENLAAGVHADGPTADKNPAAGDHADDPAADKNLAAGVHADDPAADKSPAAGTHTDDPVAGEAPEGRSRPEDARKPSARGEAAERSGDGGTVPAADTGPSAGEAPGAEDGAAPGDGGDDVFATLTSLFAADRVADRTGDRPGDPGSTASEELDEVALRRLLHGAVRDLEPSDGTLDHLHRAVPARRARRRQAVVGAAAAVLLLGTAVPAFVHVATSDGASTARPAIAGHGEQAQGGNGDESGSDAPGRRTVEPTDRRSEGATDEADPDPSPTQGEGRDPDATATGRKPDPADVDIAALPVCEPGQLGVASAGTDAPGADGTVYGRFKIANVSGKDCTVSSNGTVGFTALGAADPLKIGVVQHAAGDAAPGLPDPSQEPGTVLLKPAMAYEVRFAWVPADTCPTTGPTPSPTPTADGAGGSVGDGTDQSGDTAQSLTEDGGTADGSIAVTHTPEAGAPTAETTIPNACSGTIYRTGVLATS
ncbi:hypothetical protein [Streptomyces sp. DH8]|uniref:hypothetical protein n=1 Tax=Streptomyces sp. DH8 TaxID=2857008 RepID=UPI001E5B90C6|nr:hypothetical protein [Streptomyces sp. DH8]